MKILQSVFSLINAKDYTKINKQIKYQIHLQVRYALMNW